MSETITYEEILKRMLDRVPSGLDKREGSVIYDALAPAAVLSCRLLILNMGRRLKSWCRQFRISLIRNYILEKDMVWRLLATP